MFETYNSFIHIDIKTCKSSNSSDYKTMIPIGENQTSYSYCCDDFKANLPTSYNKNTEKEKYCLTYILSVVYNEKTLDIESVLLICIPNGYLKNIYKNTIIGKGKNKGRSFRFRYTDVRFENIEGNPKRFKYIYQKSK